MGHRKGEEADALAALARALREGKISANQPDGKHTKTEKAVAPEHRAPPAAAGTAAATEKAKNDKKAKREKKEKKEKREKGENVKKRKHGELPVDEPAEQAAIAGSHASDGLSAVAAVLGRLEEAASALRGSAAAGEDCSIAELGRQLAALSDCMAELCAALAALGGSAADPPAALGLLRAQVQQLQSDLSSLPLPSAPPMLPLQGLALQAEAAAASVRPRLTAGGSRQQAAGAAGAPLQPGEQQALRGWYLPAFADCFAAEVEALQESEPPIPAGVLLQCVRLAADSTALFPPHLARLVLAGSGSGSP
ncbi:hypothetical protein ABPG77_003383 [Micractinium sp. CCAP 211/92]